MIAIEIVLDADDHIPAIETVPAAVGDHGSVGHLAVLGVPAQGKARPTTVDADDFGLGNRHHPRVLRPDRLPGQMSELVGGPAIGQVRYVQTRDQERKTMTSPDLPGQLPVRLLEAGARCGRLLADRGHTVAVGEGSCGGLISAALLAVPGASTYYLGGSVIYTGQALAGFLSGRVERPDDLQGASEPWARHLAEAARVHLGATWGIGEGGAAGPTGNRYGNPAGHAWVAVAGPNESAHNVLTGQADRQHNMVAFAVAALDLLSAQIEDQGDPEDQSAPDPGGD